MGQSEKAAYYAELKSAGVTFDKHYREYNTAELAEAVNVLRSQPDYVAPVAPPPAAPKPQPMQQQGPAPIPAEHAYTGAFEDTPIRTDEQGRVWYREEVRKPATPAPRKRRVITYLDTGVQQQTAVDGRYIETFEVAGTERRAAEVKITLPSFQVGVYKDPRFPFKVHTYNEVKGFDLFDVQKYFGGGDLVPSTIKRLYVANDLCYDIRTTIREINDQFRQLQLNQARGLA